MPDHDLLRMVGRGSYGCVWLARNRLLNHYHAVKLLCRSCRTRPENFECELEGLRRFEPISRRHPGFVQILHVGLGSSGAFFYYVMDLADDIQRGRAIDPATYAPRTLQSDRRARGRLPLGECLCIGIHLADALHHLHAAGFVHRDLKPSNIIFVDQTPKLADVGLVGDDGHCETLIGTEGYIPPEGTGTCSADIYALGKVLYEIASGHDALHYPALPEDLDTIPDRERWLELNEIILKACAVRPADRYPTAQALKEVLEALQRGPSPRRRPPAAKRVLVSAGVLALIAAGLYWVRHTFAAKSAPDQLRWLWCTPLGFREAYCGDTEGDGRFELVAGEGSSVAIYTTGGRVLRRLRNIGELCHVGDGTGDGIAEIFAFRRSDTGHVHLTAYSSEGSAVATYEVQGAADTLLTPLRIEDLDGDGRLDLVARMMSGYSKGPRGIIVFDAAEAREIGRLEIGPVVPETLWIGPVAGHPLPRIIFGSWGVANGRIGADGTQDDASYVWCLDHRGQLLWRRGPFAAGGFFDADIVVPGARQDHRWHVVVSLREHGFQEWEGRMGRIEALRVSDGETVPELTRDFGEPVRVIAAADFTGKGRHDILVLQEVQAERRYRLRILRLEAGLPDAAVGDLGNRAPTFLAAADIDQDRRAEVLVAVGEELRVLDATLNPRAVWRRPDGTSAPIRRVFAAPLGKRRQPCLVVVSGDTRMTARVDVLEIR